MPSMYETENRRHVDDRLTDPEFARTCADYLKRLRGGFYRHGETGGGLADAFLQKWDRSPLDLYDAWPFGQLWGMLQTGKLCYGMARVPGLTPVADALVEEMNRRLEFISPPFKAEFWGELADSDGKVVSEAEDIRLGQLIRPRGEPNGPETAVEVTIPAGTVFPLEVGTNSAAKALWVLNSQGLLARWPYESEWVYLFAKRRSSGQSHRYLPDRAWT